MIYTINEQQRFIAIKENIINEEKNNRCGIGTLKEKTLHRVIKNFIEPNKEKQEVKINSFICDIFKEYEDYNIIEIQTRSFNNLRLKLSSFLNDKYKVKVVYPIAKEKYIKWINLETNEVTKRRKSPKTGKIYDAVFELYKIKSFLNNPNLTISLMFLDIEEYRYLNGWSNDLKRGSTRCDQIPNMIFETIDLIDYSIFIPKHLTFEQFTSKQLAKECKISIKTSQLLLNILNYLNVVEVVSKNKNQKIYKKTYNY